MDNSSPLTASMPSIPLPPRAQLGSRDPAPSAQDFRSMLETEGVRPPKTAAEAKITAAQIADKAGVNARVKRDHVWSGMDTTPAAAPAVAPDRFLPLRQGPTAARIFNTPSNNSASIETLRATAKFAPGSVNSAASTQATAPAVAAVAQSVKRTAAKTDAETEAATTADEPPAVEAYTFGLRAAADNKPGTVPPWFSNAMQNGLDKYEAMKTSAQ